MMQRMLRRRSMLQGGASAALVLLTGCTESEKGGEPGETPDGEPRGNPGHYEMPLESEAHERTFMQWPVSLDVYTSNELVRVQSAIARIANAIADFEPVVMLAGAKYHAAARGALSENVELWDVPTDDLWCRDSGPTFVRNSAGQLAVAHIAFNGWGNKQPHRNDRAIATRVADRLGMAVFKTGLIGEQGGIEHDGAGTLLAHASCWVNKNRNPQPMTEIEAMLLKALGGRKMIWAPGIIGADITDYHIDALARFVAPGKVLIQMPESIDPDDPWSRSAFQTLKIITEATDATGKPLSVTTLYEPVDIRSGQNDFVASYVNYYVCNGAVISAQFGDADADVRAIETLQNLYPGREIVALNVDALGENGGGIHCATQQQPKAGAV